MTNQRDPDLIIARWLDEGPNELPEVIRRAIAVNAQLSAQSRRPIWVPWRSPNMFSSWKLATLAVAVVLALGGAAWMLGRGSGTAPAGVTPSASAPRSAAPSLSPLPSVGPSPSARVPYYTGNWVGFTSGRYAYQIAHPPTWTGRPATRNWSLATDRLDWTTDAADSFIDVGQGGNQILVTSFAVDVPAGTSEDQWITDYYGPEGAGCGVTVGTLVPTTVDGHPGRIATASTCGDDQAFVFIGHRVHVFAVWREGYEPLLEAFLSTVTFSLAASPSPS